MIAFLVETLFWLALAAFLLAAWLWVTNTPHWIAEAENQRRRQEDQRQAIAQAHRDWEDAQR